MILYFSGTGNSRYIARRIAEETQDSLFCINDAIRNHAVQPITVENQLVFVVPTYAWRIPRIVEQWIRETPFRGTDKAWFVMDCGSEIGNADKYLRKLCQDKQFTYMGVTEIVMPENYIAVFNAPATEKAKQIIIGKAMPAVRSAIEAIRSKKPFADRRISMYARMMSAVVNPIFYRIFVRANAFRTTDACTHCGKCTRLCPLNNITLKNGTPVWGNQCTHCMACICHCPAEAIEYGKKTVGKPRYHID